MHLGSRDVDVLPHVRQRAGGGGRAKLLQIRLQHLSVCAEYLSEGICVIMCVCLLPAYRH